MIPAATPRAPELRNGRAGPNASSASSFVGVKAALLIVVAATALGIALRLVQYLDNRSLWLDEAMLALNLLDRSAAQLAGTLDFHQVAPVGFLEAEKLLTHVSGSSELSLRLFPLLLGLLSVPMFALLAWRLLGPSASALATCVFACSPGAVYYASEVKQYSSDVAVSVLLLGCGFMLLDPTLSTRRRALVGAIGALAVPFSTSSIFVVGAVVATVVARLLRTRDRRTLSALYPALAWALAGLVFVIFTVTRAARLQAALAPTVSGESSGTPSSPVGHVRVLNELASGIWRSAGYPDSAPARYLHWPLVVLALLGCISLLRRRPWAASIVLLPFFAVSLAAVIGRYPIFDRTVLFLVPATVILVAEGAVALVGLVRTPRRRSAVAAVVASAVLVSPLARAATNAVHPIRHEEVKAVLEYVRQQWRPGDGMFVDIGTRFTMRYYLECGCLRAAEDRTPGEAWRFGATPARAGHEPMPLRSNPPRFIVGSLAVDNFATFEAELGPLLGRPRVWLVVSHIGSGGSLRRIRAVLDELGRRGKLLESYRAVGASAYLYNLRAISN